MTSPSICILVISSNGPRATEEERGNSESAGFYSVSINCHAHVDECTCLIYFIFANLEKSERITLFIHMNSHWCRSSLPFPEPEGYEVNITQYSLLLNTF